MNTPGASVQRFLDEALAGHGHEGVRLSLELLDSGAPADSVIADLLAAAQVEVGERWLRNEWSVADEHLATAVAQKALDAVAGSAPLPATGSNVVVACAVGDWHSLPAQMFAERLSLRGCRVSFLGASTPVDHVEALLGRQQFDALAVSCNVPLFFDGVASLAAAAHRQGTAVIAGGRGLGSDERRASMLGADAWAEGADEAALVIDGWRATPPTTFRERLPAPAAAGALQEQVEAVADQAVAALLLALPRMETYTAAQLERTREDLVYIVLFVRAALMVEDATVLHHFIDWVAALLDARGVPLAALDQSLAVLSPLLAAVDPSAGELIDHALARRAS
jgi:methanogenic corrinoid protein MtbC1